MIHASTFGASFAAQPATRPVSASHHNNEPVNIPSANTAACSNVDQAAIEANKPAKNRIVGGLASVSR